MLRRIELTAEPQSFTVLNRSARDRGPLPEGHLRWSRVRLGVAAEPSDHLQPNPAACLRESTKVAIKTKSKSKIRIKIKIKTRIKIRIKTRTRTRMDRPSA